MRCSGTSMPRRAAQRRGTQGDGAGACPGDGRRSRISGSAMPPATWRMSCGRAIGGGEDGGGIDAALEAVAGIAGEAEPARGAADGLGIEEGALEKDIDCGIGDAAGLAAHDAGDGGGGVRIGDDEIGGGEA